MGFLGASLDLRNPYVGDTIPSGGVIWFNITWAQALVIEAAGVWTICDGTNGTEDLVGRPAPDGDGIPKFIRSVAFGADAGLTAGANAHTHAGAGGHNHTAGPLLLADAVGDHSHTGTTCACTSVCIVACADPGECVSPYNHVHYFTTSPAGGHGHTISGNTADVADHGHGARDNIPSNITHIPMMRR